jgi:hypothetical protein
MLRGNRLDQIEGAADIESRPRGEPYSSAVGSAVGERRIEI